MDTIKSFKGYGKVDEREQQAFQKKTRKRITIIIISTIILLAVIIAAVAATIIHKRNTKSQSPSTDSLPKTELNPATSLKAVCESTQYPNSCFSSISSLSDSNTTDPEQLFKLSLKVAIDEFSNLTRLPSKLNARVRDDTRLKKAISVCSTVFNDALDRLEDSMSELTVAGKILSPAKVRDVETWISAALTDHDTCLDAVSEVNNNTAANGVLREIETAMKNSTEFASNSLAIVTKIIGLLSNFETLNHHRRLLGDFPVWLGTAERRLLQAVNTTITPDAVVAKDGSGQFTTIAAALKMVKPKSDKRFVVYVKKGQYLENIDLDKNHWNVMIYGDGMTETVVVGGRNFIDGTPTFETATFAVKGKGFIAKDIKFVNNAGASKHQAVALRSGSDQSVFYKCSFDGYQDTLYAHSNRQFYRECDITGTIDFIFGNAAVVFQNCKIMPRQPMSNQFNTITAQGKKDPNQNTGIVIQKSTITTLANDNLIAPTYLGRPWKDYSTTVIMKSTIGPFLKPVGWISWVANVEPPSTILYAEYQNTGPGADVASRVKWAGYKPALGDNDATKFTVDSFIQGPEWLPNAAVQFDSTL